MPTVLAGDVGADYGIVIGILNLDLAWDIEIERAPGDGTGSPDTANSEIIDTVPGWTRKYVDERAAGSGTWCYRWRTNLSGCSAGAWSDWFCATPEEIPDTLPDLPNVPPVIIAKWDSEQTDDTTGKITLEVIDFEQRVTDLEFAQKLGGDTQFSVWKSSWDMTTGTKGSDLTLTRSESFTLHEKHNVIVKGRVKWDAPEGGTREEILSPYTMDIDRTPELFDPMMRVGAGDGSVFATARGDSDVANIYGRFAENSTPADPDGTETDSTAGEINVASQTISDKDTGLDVSEGSTVNGKIRGENASGTLGPVVDLHLDRFDFDDEAEVNTLTGAIDEPDGSVLVSAGADDDTDTIYIRANVGSAPADPDGTEDNATAGQGKITTRSGTVDTDTIADPQETGYIKARGENPDGTLGPVKETRVERPASNLIDWQVDQTISGATGTVSVQVDDPHLRVTAIEFQKKTGPGNFGGTWVSTWDTSTGTIGSDTTLNRSEDVTLTEKHNVGIKVRIQYDDRSGTNRTVIPPPATFDVDEIAELRTLALAVDDDNGSVILSWGGDDDTSGIRWRDNIGSQPNAPDGSATDETASGRAGSTDTGDDLSTGQTLFVKAAAETSGGSLGPVREVRISREKGEHSLASLNASVNTDGTIDVTVKGGSRTSSLDVSFDFTNDGTFDETQSSGNGVQSFDATSLGTVAVGDKAKVRGRAFTGDNQSGDSVTATLTITRPDLEPGFTKATISVKDNDDGSTDNWEVAWAGNGAVDTSVHDIDLVFYHNGAKVGDRRSVSFTNDENPDRITASNFDGNIDDDLSYSSAGDGETLNEDDEVVIRLMDGSTVVAQTSAHSFAQVI